MIPASLIARLADARTVTVLTGAGVSRASGVPTFRGQDGLWRSHRAEALATPAAFAADPLLVWQWYDWRRQLVARCRPNRGHEVLAEWSRRWPIFTLVTQNVDGLHERAGTAGVLRLHGSLWDVKCSQGCARGAAPERDDRVPLEPLPPRCPHCGGLQRPAVVWFGEALDPATWRAAERAASCDVFFTVGTSAVVYPAASLLDIAHGAGAYMVEINVDPTARSADVDLVLPGPAETLLGDLANALERG